MEAIALHTTPSAGRLLLVDDDAPTREALYEALQEWSFTTFVAASLLEARNAVLTEERFTIIVSDYQLPDGNGLEFLDWLKREAQVDVPFLLISGGKAPLPAAADGYEFLAKPFRLQEFHQCLERLSRSRRPPAAVPHPSVAQSVMASVYARYQPPRGK